MRDGTVVAVLRTLPLRLLIVRRELRAHPFATHAGLRSLDVHAVFVFVPAYPLTYFLCGLRSWFVRQFALAGVPVLFVPLRVVQSLIVYRRLTIAD